MQCCRDSFLGILYFNYYHVDKYLFIPNTRVLILFTINQMLHFFIKIGMLFQSKSYTFFLPKKITRHKRSLFFTSTDEVFVLVYYHPFIG